MADSSKADWAWMEIKFGCEQSSCLYMQCTYIFNTSIYRYVLIHSLLGWMQLKMVILNAVYDSLCLITYAAMVQQLFTGRVLSKYYWVLEVVQTCVYMHVYVCTQTCMYIHAWTVYIRVCTILPNDVHGYTRIPRDMLFEIIRLYHIYIYIYIYI